MALINELSPHRLPGETQEEYKERRARNDKMFHFKTHNGRLLHDSSQKLDPKTGKMLGQTAVVNPNKESDYE